MNLCIVTKNFKKDICKALNLKINTMYLTFAQKKNMFNFPT